jgi:hypothetical protein
MPLGVLAFLASPYAYISQIPMILFAAICTLIVVNKPSEIPFMKALKGIFSRGPESAAIRSKAIKVLAVFLVINWLVLVISVPTCAWYISQLYSGKPWSYPKSDLAPADEASYQQVLSKFASKNYVPYELYRLIPIVMPDDLLSILKTHKNVIFSSSHSFKPLKSSDKQSDANSPSAENSHSKIKFRDVDIISAMGGCGRDVVNILVDAMEKPERESALVIRAKLGDVRVKKKLEELLALRLANGEPPSPQGSYNDEDRPAKTIDIICALACISEPNEVKVSFLNYVTNSDMSQLMRSYRLFNGIQLLQTPQAREVIKAYLSKAQDWRPPERVMSDGEKFREDVSMALWPIHGTAGTYSDRDISEAILKIMLRSEDKHIVRDWGWQWEIPQAFDIQSADLLRQGLGSKNEPLRAWCVWQLRKVGYTFSEEEISRLLTDESWKVRANAVMAAGPKAGGLAAKDPNPFVRLVASFAAVE